MKIHYDESVDALYLELGDNEPDGVIEVPEGVNTDTTAGGKIAGIEILKASKRINMNTILSYTLDLDHDLFQCKRLKPPPFRRADFICSPHAGTVKYPKFICEGPTGWIIATAVIRSTRLSITLSGLRNIGTRCCVSFR